MITITESAKNKAIELMKVQKTEPSDTFIRVSVQGGGCSGLTCYVNWNLTTN